MALDALRQFKILSGENERCRIDIDNRDFAVCPSQHCCQRAAAASNQQYFVRFGLEKEPKEGVNIGSQTRAVAVRFALTTVALQIGNRAIRALFDDIDGSKLRL